MKTTIVKRNDLINYYMNMAFKYEANAKKTESIRRMNIYLSLAKKMREKANHIYHKAKDSYIEKLHNDLIDELIILNEIAY